MNNLNKDLRNPSPDIMNTLLKAAAAQMNTDPETLRRSLQSGELKRSIMNAPAGDPAMQKLKQALSDPKTAEKILSDPRAAEILRQAKKG